MLTTPSCLKRYDLGFLKLYTLAFLLPLLSFIALSSFAYHVNVGLSRVLFLAKYSF